MMKTLSLHMQTNNGVFTNMGIVYVAPVQNKAGIHLAYHQYGVGSRPTL
jgi:hypothetical protein